MPATVRVIVGDDSRSCETPLLKEYSSSAHGEESQVRPLKGRELEILRLVVQGKTVLRAAQS